MVKRRGLDDDEIDVHISVALKEEDDSSDESSKQNVDDLLAEVEDETRQGNAEEEYAQEYGKRASLAAHGMDVGIEASTTAEMPNPTRSRKKRNRHLQLPMPDNPAGPSAAESHEALDRAMADMAAASADGVAIDAATRMAQILNWVTKAAQKAGASEADIGRWSQMLQKGLSPTAKAKGRSVGKAMAQMDAANVVVESRCRQAIVKELAQHGHIVQALEELHRMESKGTPLPPEGYRMLAAAAALKATGHAGDNPDEGATLFTKDRNSKVGGKLKDQLEKRSEAKRRGGGQRSASAGGPTEGINDPAADDSAWFRRYGQCCFCLAQMFGSKMTTRAFMIGVTTFSIVSTAMFLIFALVPACLELAANGDLQDGAECTIHSASVADRGWSALHNIEVKVKLCIDGGACSEQTANRYGTDYPWDTEDHANDYVDSLVVNSKVACFHKDASGVAMTSEVPGACWVWFFVGLCIPILNMIALGIFIRRGRMQSWPWGIL